jgi:nucleotide-binding universal stress UspA family protein
MGHHWRRICCPVDFSESSRATLMEAAVLASRGNSELTILHVYERTPLRAAGELLVSDPEREDRRATDVRAQLDRLRTDAERLVPGRVSAEAACGDPVTEIVRFAERGQYDALVMGSHGAKGLRRLVAGSVTESVMRRAPCSVVVVREALHRVEAD